MPLGCCSTYGNVDFGLDKILPGAFSQTIATQGAGLPLLWCHSQADPVGTGKLSDSPAGLVLTGKLLLSDPTAAKAYTFMRAGAVRGLSIGYSVPDDPAKVSFDETTGVRTLREVRVHEVSLVAVPMNPLARVTAVKTLTQVEGVLRKFAPSEVDAAALMQLESISREVKRLMQRKDEFCECTCPECLAGDCENCSNEECIDPNCEGSQAAIAEQLAALRAISKALAG